MTISTNGAQMPDPVRLLEDHSVENIGGGVRHGDGYVDRGSWKGRRGVSPSRASSRGESDTGPDGTGSGAPDD